MAIREYRKIFLPPSISYFEAKAKLLEQLEELVPGNYEYDYFDYDHETTYISL